MNLLRYADPEHVDQIAKIDIFFEDSDISQELGDELNKTLDQMTHLKEVIGILNIRLFF